MYPQNPRILPHSSIPKAFLLPTFHPPLSSPPSSHRGRPQAQAVIGPFELDPITRMSLENIVSSGASRFPVRHFRDQNDPHPWLGRRVSVSVDWGRECWWVEGVHGI